MSFNAWEPKNLIGGQKYVVANVNFKACHVKSAAVTEFMVISH